MAATNRYDHLSEVQLFSALSPHDLERIDAASDEVDLKEGRVLVEQGTLGHEFFLIMTGEAVVQRNGSQVATLGPGQYFGELSLLAKGPRDATVVAATDMRVLVIAQREFLGILEEVPGLPMKMLRHVAERLRAVESTL